MAGIQLQDVRKSFDGKAVIQGITLDIPKGAFLVLLGPSGCGKSTLLRMIAGLESLTSGTITVGTRRVDQLPPGERDMAFVFQSYALYPHMTVRGNITFPLLMQRFRWWFHVPIVGWFARRQIERDSAVIARVEGAARTLGLMPMMDRKPATLSGGQRQRVALGRAMVRNPQVFLMDEPLSNLDAKLRTSMRAEIGKLHREVGGTFVYVTHDQIEAMTMGSLIVVLKEGAVQQVGTAEDIYAAPANVYVARFIGSPPMNVMVAQVSGGHLIVDGQAAGPAAAPDGPVLAGFRPGALTLGPPGAGLPGTGLPGTGLQGTGLPGTGLAGRVSLIEHVGAETVVAVQLDSVETRHDTDAAPGEVIVTVPGRGTFQVGDAVAVHMPAGGAVLFDSATGSLL